jgi:hypothetical protein
LVTYIEKYTTPSRAPENGGGSLDLHHHPPANISDVCGSSWWGILHGVATSIRDHGCATCGEHAISLMEYAHDLVNVSLEKPAEKPRSIREWTPFALQLATMPEYEVAEVNQAQRKRRIKCNFNEDTFKAIPGEVNASIKDLRALQRTGNAEGFVEELNSLCGTVQPRLPLSQEADVKIKGACKPQGCSLEATTGGKSVVKEPKIKIPITELTSEGIDRAVREARRQLAAALGEVDPEPVMPKKKVTPTEPKTFAVTDGQQIELTEKLVPIDSVISSNNPETGAVNPNYPGWLQPRDRERAMNMVQVQKMAANLEPFRLIQDFHTLDRGSPVVAKLDQDWMVVSGNGRAMAIQLAKDQYPDLYTDYLNALPMSGSATKNVMLVRVIVESDQERLREIAELGNVSAALATSTVEQASIDSAKLTAEFVGKLKPLEDETASIEETVRADKNRTWVTEFLGLIPENELAAVADSKGTLSESGVRRVVMALAMWVFGVEDGNRIAEIAFESPPGSNRNIVQGTLRAVPRLATMIARINGWVSEATPEQVATAVAARDELNISPAIAKSILRYSDLRHSGITISDYLSQASMGDFIDRTPIQDQIIKMFDDNKRSAKRISEILTAYTDQVEVIQNPNQAGFFDEPGDRVKPGTAEKLLATAIAEEKLLEPVAMFQMQRANVRLDKLLLEATT